MNQGLGGAFEFLAKVACAYLLVVGLIVGGICYGFFKLGQNWHKVPSVKLEIVPVTSSSR